jgi:hypothetical protein
MKNRMENVMNCLFRSTLFLAISAFAVTANATLMPVLGGQALYDTDLDITWLSKGNAPAGSGFDDGAAGTISWGNANDWAASLNVGGFSGWRLPATVQPDTSCGTQTDPGGGLPLQGSGSGCTGSELGHLFSMEAVSTASPGLFSGLGSEAYWSKTSSPLDDSRAWIFYLADGHQSMAPKDRELLAIAVHDGDISKALVTTVVPIPAAAWLFGSALCLLGWVRHRQRS